MNNVIYAIFRNFICKFEVINFRYVRDYVVYFVITWNIYGYENEIY